MAEEWCDFGDLPVEQCAHCRPQEPAPKKDEPTGFRRGGGIQAKYSGRCPGCGDFIEVGDLITESDGTYVHKECA